MAILIALGFLVFSVPLITGSLGLAQTINIDARVKAEITQKDYCGLAVKEFISYQISPNAARWGTWLDSDEGGGGFNNEMLDANLVDLCGEDISLNVLRTDQKLVLSEEGDPFGTIPDDVNQQQIKNQVTKPVSATNPVTGADTVSYTITVVNRSDGPEKINTIRDFLPEEFSYKGPGTWTLRGLDQGSIVPEDELADPLVWELGDPDITLQPQERVTLEFKANIPEVGLLASEGTYCNVVEATPNKQQQTSGHTAIVNIGDTDGLCTEKAVKVTQVTNAVWNKTEECAAPFLCPLELFYIDYTIRIENLENEELEIQTIENWLPIGYRHDRTLCPLPLNDLCVFEDPEEPPHKIDVRDRIKWKNLGLDLESGPDKAVAVKFRVWADEGGLAIYMSTRS